MVHLAIQFSADDEARLRQLCNDGVSCTTMAFEFGLSIPTITKKLNQMGLRAFQRSDYSPSKRLDPVVFPQFENITKAEAAAVSRSVPNSRKPGRPEYGRSLLGCSAYLCTR